MHSKNSCIFFFIVLIVHCSLLSKFLCLLFKALHYLTLAPYLPLLPKKNSVLVMEVSYVLLCIQASLPHFVPFPTLLYASRHHLPPNPSFLKLFLLPP